MRSGERLRSIGMPLEELFNFPVPILKKLIECHKAVRSNFRVIFYNTDHDSPTIEKFFKEHSDLLFKLNVTITKDLLETSFFHINYDLENNPYHRYGYIGGPLQGIEEFKKLIKHISMREQEGYR